MLGFYWGADELSDREKLSFSERDKRRREKKNGSGRGGGGSETRSEAAQRRSRQAAARYRRQVEDRLFGKKADRGRLRLEERLRAAQGTPNFFRTFREYLKSYGMPEDMGLLMLLLDLEPERDVLKVTEAIDGKIGTNDVSAEQKSLLRSRLRNLEMATQSDAVADAAAELLGRL